MSPIALDAAQQTLVDLPLDARIFLEGPAGAGKTTAAVARLRRLLAEGVPGDSILLLTPQRTLAAAYDEVIRQPSLPAGGLVAVLTVGGLSQRMVDLFWPLVAEAGCFAHPERPPAFLTLETAQYNMARVVKPLLDAGYFESITVDRNRLYSQILDNLNKAAVAGFPPNEIAARLRAAWTGESSQVRVYDEAQDCALRFREYCLANNLLDFSLQYELFTRHLWRTPACRDYLLARYSHLLVDNVEEDTAVAHDVLREWLPATASALVIYDYEAGYRRFLGADPGGAYTLRDTCSRRLSFTRSYVVTPDLQRLAADLGRALGKGRTIAGRPAPRPPVMATAPAFRASAVELAFDQGIGPDPEGASPAPNIPRADAQPSAGGPCLVYKDCRYYPQMIDWAADEIARLVHDLSVPAGQIAVLAPFMTDSLRFLLLAALERRQVPARSHRPSRALRDEPAARCLLTLAALAHPSWRSVPPAGDVVQALVQAIEDLDLVRAQLLVDVLYRPRDAAFTLGSFDGISPELQERITFRLGVRYQGLHDWLATYVAAPPAVLDHFFSRLFGEVLSQAGYGFHAGLDAGQVAANLIESVAKFRRAAGPTGLAAGHEYLAMAQEGVVAAQYVRAWRPGPDDAVLLAPAHTFIMSNRAVDYQFWLDAGSSGWWERLYQPLTHPYVLSRAWPPGKLWGDREEFEARSEALYYLTAGLVRRCRCMIYLGFSELGTEGTDQQGPLLAAFQRVLRWNGSRGTTAGRGD